MKLVFANSSYRSHMTDEGWQLQEGLGAQGWVQVGRGYAACDETNTHRIMERFDPSMIFVQDARDWDPASGGCYDRSVSFENIEALSGHPATKIVVCKDAGSVVDYQAEFARKIGATMAITYYHDDAILPLSPWLSALTRVRTYHSIDTRLFIKAYAHEGRTRRAVVSGAMNPEIYPIRWQCGMEATAIGLDIINHPGYGIYGSQVSAYIRMLAMYRVHVATASRYGFALRKIIESVAIGCTPVTNLPASDVLPMIDGALVRIPNRARLPDICAAVDQADRTWDRDERAMWAQRAWHFYDWRMLGARLSFALHEAERTKEIAA